MKKNFVAVAIISLCLLLSCIDRHPVKPGSYTILDIQGTKDADLGKILSYPLPVFQFRNKGKLCITPDFNFGYFKDSLFSYKLKDGYLYLKGQHIKHKIICEPDTIGNKHNYELYLDSEQIIKITIIEK